jgi:hypothetical protein
MDVKVPSNYTRKFLQKNNKILSNNNISGVFKFLSFFFVFFGTPKICVASFT